MDILVLRFDAPLMSFGAPIVDNRGEIQPYPALSMMTGLLGNALGVDHAESGRLESLQERLRYAVRQDRKGRQIRDYQTVDLSKPYMDDDGAWTTRDELEKRKGGSASTGTHIRLRDYWADAIHTVALTLDLGNQSPTLDEIEAALQHPERPLFIGRKTCLPAGSLFLGRLQAEDLRDALTRVEPADRADAGASFPAWWPIHPDSEPPSEDDTSTENMRRPVTDRRDWRNQIHVGERWIAEGEIKVIKDDKSHA